MLPEWLGQVRLDGLRIANSSVTLAFERDGSVTGFALLGQRGTVNVTLAAGE